MRATPATSTRAEPQVVAASSTRPSSSRTAASCARPDRMTRTLPLRVRADRRQWAGPSGDQSGRTVMEPFPVESRTSAPATEAVSEPFTELASSNSACTRSRSRVPLVARTTARWACTSEQSMRPLAVATSKPLARRPRTVTAPLTVSARRLARASAGSTSSRSTGPASHPSARAVR